MSSEYNLFIKRARATVNFLHHNNIINEDTEEYIDDNADKRICLKYVDLLSEFSDKMYNTGEVVEKSVEELKQLIYEQAGSERAKTEGFDAAFNDLDDKIEFWRSVHDLMNILKEDAEMNGSLSSFEEAKRKREGTILLTSIFDMYDVVRKQVADFMYKTG